MREELTFHLSHCFTLTRHENGDEQTTFRTFLCHRLQHQQEVRVFFSEMVDVIQHQNSRPMIFLLEYFGLPPEFFEQGIKGFTLNY